MVPKSHLGSLLKGILIPWNLAMFSATSLEILGSLSSQVFSLRLCQDTALVSLECSLTYWYLLLHGCATLYFTSRSSAIHNYTDSSFNSSCYIPLTNISVKCNPPTRNKWHFYILGFCIGLITQTNKQTHTTHCRYLQEQTAPVDLEGKSHRV